MTMNHSSPLASLDAYWADLIHNFQQNDDVALRREAALQIGVLKQEHHKALRHKGERTIREQALVDQALATVPIIERLFETADASQLRDVIDGMVGALPSDCI